jgi:hypothetical protein
MEQIYSTEKSCFISKTWRYNPDDHILPELSYSYFFSVALKSTDRTALNARMVSEWWNEKEVEGSGRGLAWDTTPALARTDYGIHEKPL